MFEDLGKKLAKRIDDDILLKERKAKKEKSVFKKNKVIDDVLDETTIMTLSELISSNILSFVNGVIGSGKESKVYWGVDQKGRDLALKIYLVTTSNFKKRSNYLLGDPRFAKVKKGTRNIVEAWTQKEYSNLIQCIKTGIPSVKPIGFRKNILVLDFVGKNGVPEKTLVETEVDQKDYENTISIIENLYKKAHLVHADFSEYNIFKTKKGLIVFDFGSAVDVRHRNAREFLERDIKNISRFFVKRGLTVENPVDTIERIIN